MIDDDVTDNLVIEHLRRMRATQTAMAEDLHDVQLRMAHIERGFGNLHAEIANWQHLMSSLNSRINRAGDSIDALVSAIHRTNERMGRIEERLGGLDERFEGLQGRFDALDGRVGALDARIGALDERIGALDERIGALDERIGALDGRIGALNERVGSLEQRFDGLETTVKQGFAQLSEQLTQLAR